MNRTDPTRSLSAPGLTLVALAAAMLLVAPLSAQAVEVDAADPASAEQGTVNLDVTIKGNGFGQGATVDFWVTGTTNNPGGVVVKNVIVRGPRKLIANIDIDELAVVSDFDIEVAVNGRVGKGTELFAVLEKDSSQPNREQDTPVCVSFRDDAFSDKLMSDGEDRDNDGLVDTYCQDKKRKTYAHIGRRRGQFRLITNTSNKAGAGRTGFIDFSDCLDTSCTPPFASGFPESVDFNTAQTLDLYTMPVGTSATVAMRVRFYLLDPGDEDLWEIGFGDVHPPNPIDCTDGDPVVVTRVDASTWTIEATVQEACLDAWDFNGAVTNHGHFTFPFELTITLDE